MRFAAFLILSAALLGCQERARLSWSATYDEALREAKTKNTIVLVDFYAVWCEPCQQLDSQTYTDPSILRRSAQFARYKANVDTEEGRALAEKLGAAGVVPTLVFLDSKGEELHRYVGFLSAADLNTHLDRAFREAGLQPK